MKPEEIPKVEIPYFNDFIKIINEGKVLIEPKYNMEGDVFYLNLLKASLYKALQQGFKSVDCTLPSDLLLTIFYCYLKIYKL